MLAINKWIGGSSRSSQNGITYAPLGYQGQPGSTNNVRSRRLPLFAWVGLLVLSCALARWTIFYPGRTDYIVEEMTASSLSSSNTNAQCHSDKARTNPHGIQRPAERTELEIEVIGNLWAKLEDLFSANEPRKGRWGSIGRPEAEVARRGHANILAGVPAYPLHSGSDTTSDATQIMPLFSGKGIVMMAGSRYSGYAVTALGMLRQAGSRLPVEVWFKDEHDESPGWCEELHQEGMTCRRISDYIPAASMAHISKGFQLKVLAILFSSFQELLYLDADNFVLSNPDAIFNAVTYTSTGAVIWQDYWRHGGSLWLPYATGLASDQSTMFFDDQTAESGQMLWDKKRHWRSLLLAAWYNWYGPEFWYDTILALDMAGYGDKDSFWLALRASGEEYTYLSHPTRSAFLTNSTYLAAMVQAYPSERGTPFQALFLHSNSIKWSLASLFDPWYIKPWARFWYQWRLGQYHAMRKLLNDNQRLIWQGEWAKAYGSKAISDPEQEIWRSLEYNACNSRAMGGAFYCARTRGHMQRTFGARFMQVAGSGQVCPTPT